MKSEKNRNNNLPWEGTESKWNLAKVFKLAIVLAMAALVVFTAYQSATQGVPTGPETIEPHKDVSDCDDAAIGGGVNVEDAGYMQLRFEYVDEATGERLLPGVLTWALPGEEYFVEVPEIEGYTTDAVPHRETMGRNDQIVYVHYKSVNAEPDGADDSPAAYLSC